MENNVIRCPNCGGDVDVIASQSIIECPYCNSDIVNTYFDDRKDEITNYLIAAKTALARGEMSDCNVYLDKASLIESDCADVWYMKAAMYSKDHDVYQNYKERASKAKVRFGLFTETDMERYRCASVKVKKNMTKFWFAIGAFFIIFFGGSLSLGLGVGLGILTPLYVTIALLVVLLVIYLIVMMKQKR